MPERWEWCPAAQQIVPTGRPVWDGEQFVAPSWPGEGCCEYGHMPVSLSRRERMKQWVNAWWVTIRAQRRREARRVLRHPVTADDFVEVGSYEDNG